MIADDRIERKSGYGEMDNGVCWDVARYGIVEYWEYWRILPDIEKSGKYSVQWRVVV